MFPYIFQLLKVALFLGFQLPSFNHVHPTSVLVTISSLTLGLQPPFSKDSYYYIGSTHLPSTSWVQVSQLKGFPGTTEGKESPAVQETRVQSFSWEDPLEMAMATHASIFAWRIPWTEGPGELQPMGLQRVRHD